MECKACLVVRVILFLYISQVLTETPDYDPILQKLHESIVKTFKQERSNKDVKIKHRTGKFFKYPLTAEEDYDLSGSTYQVTEAGKSSLPRWLTFHKGTGNLVGVPSKSDAGSYVIESKKGNDGSSVRYVKIDVPDSRESFDCKGKPVSAAHIILHTDIENLIGQNRVRLLRQLAEIMDVSVHETRLNEGNGMDEDTLLGSSLVMAGPGDKISGKRKGVTLSFKVKCSIDIAGERSIALLKSYSQNGQLGKLLGYDVSSWFVTSMKGRFRRNVVAGSLAPTPAVTRAPVAGTPTVTPSPSMVKPSPTPSSIPVPTTPAPATDPPTEKPTDPPTDPPTEPPTNPPTEPPTAPPTEKPTTEKQTDPPTQPPTEAVTVPDASPRTKKATNAPPVIINGIDKIDIEVYQASEYALPNKMFYDEDDTNLDLKMMMFDPNDKIVPVPDNFWISFNPSLKSIFLLPLAEHQGSNQFVMQASDRQNPETNAFFKVEVRGSSRLYENRFNVTLEADFDLYKSSVEKRVKLVQKIASAMGSGSYEKHRTFKFHKGSVVVEWGLEDMKDSCNDPTYVAYKKRLESKEFVEEMLPTEVKGQGVISKCPDGSGVTDKTNQRKGDAVSWWDRVMIPVIVIVIILLIIALILCCVYRRRRKYVPSDDEDKHAHLLNKKPVIFLEEYDEKPDFVSLQPVVLPNEKPPIPNSFEPRSGSPDPQYSSSVSTESDEKAPMVPNSPKDGRHGYNAPPPYSAH